MNRPSPFLAFSATVTEGELSCSRCCKRGMKMSSSDIEYYRQRASAERQLAEAARDAKIAELHEELASLYQRMLDALEGPSSQTAT